MALRSRPRRKPAPKGLGRLLRRLRDPLDTQMAAAVAACLLIAESLLCIYIIRSVPYTEIDWEAYMEEVQGYQQGERDYSNLKGGTGPLVYPAGFVYLYSWLRRMTRGAVAPAQCIFAVLYVATQAVVMALYIRARSVPPWSLALLCLSRRLHSIYVLRLFNDCWAMFVAYLATWVLQSRRWAMAIVLFSLAVSIKMNVLLLAPGVLAVVIKEAPIMDAARGVVAGVLLQLVLGAPFLLHKPEAYLGRAFEFSRVFMYKWTVNWRFIPEAWFVSKRLALILMLLHARLLWTFGEYEWFKGEGGLWPALASFVQRTTARPASLQHRTLDSDGVLQIVFASNMVGILCARSLHYQFYSWYFHMLPFLLLRTRLHPSFSVALMVSIEAIWNMYPPSAAASALLVLLHAAVVVACRWFHRS